MSTSCALFGMSKQAYYKQMGCHHQKEAGLAPGKTIHIGAAEGDATAGNQEAALPACPEGHPYWQGQAV